MGVENGTSIRVESKHHLALRLMAALGRIQKSRDRAENDHEAGAQKRHDRNHDDGDNGQYQGVFDQGLPFLAGHVPDKRYEKWFNDGSHM
jgi:hypothetical protein